MKASKLQLQTLIPKLIITLITLAFVLTILNIHYPNFHHSNTLPFSLHIEYLHHHNTINSTPLPPQPTRRHGGGTSPPPLVSDRTAAKEKYCDLFTGDWVPDAEGPYYTNETCNAIHDHQNCMKHGHPDTGYLKWRWRPDGCELPRFEPARFLEMMRGKSMLFVGDSIARNHVQSLICLLSRVGQPTIPLGPEEGDVKNYEYRDYSFKVSVVFSPYLIRTQRSDPNDETRPFHLFLDEPDDTWTARIRDFDYVVISAAHWFFRPSYFYLNRTLVGCLYCSDPAAAHLPFSFAYRSALRTALRSLGAAGTVTFMRTFAPSHYEGGQWDNGGDCLRRRPYRRNETGVREPGEEVYRIQAEEVGIARRAGEGTGGKLRLFDVTKAIALRADGHPSKYGRTAGANEILPKDCLHWCLPGPIHAWNDFLQELLRRELGGNSHEL